MRLKLVFNERKWLVHPEMLVVMIFSDFELFSEVKGTEKLIGLDRIVLIFFIPENVFAFIFPVVIHKEYMMLNVLSWQGVVRRWCFRAAQGIFCSFVSFLFKA